MSKSPLKSTWTSGKSLSAIKGMIPNGSIVHTFMFHDGILELELSKTKRFIVSHTNKYAIYEFWQCLLNDHERVAAVADHFYPIDNKNIFYILQKNWLKYPDPFVRSGMFFLLNRLSDTGYATHGEFVDDPEIPSVIQSLKKFAAQNYHLQFDKDDNIVNCIQNINTKCDYVFAPIGPFSMNLFEDGKEDTYVQSKIIHKDIRKLLDTTDKSVMLLYKYSKPALEFYEGYNTTIVDQWGRTTKSDNFAKELIVANF